MIKKLLKGLLHADWTHGKKPEAGILDEFYHVWKRMEFPEAIGRFQVKNDGGYLLGSSYRLLISDLLVGEIHCYAGCEFIELTEAGNAARPQVFAEMQRIVREQKQQDEARKLRAAQKIKEALLL